LWSRKKKTVPVIDLKVAITRWGEDTWGELKAYFPMTTWNTQKDGLIYTDKLWMEEFRVNLCLNGLSKEAADDLDYSEQGMQGHDYVSMDVGHTFIKELDELYRFSNGQNPRRVNITVEDFYVEDD